MRSLSGTIMEAVTNEFLGIPVYASSPILGGYGGDFAIFVANGSFGEVLHGCRDRHMKRGGRSVDVGF